MKRDRREYYKKNAEKMKAQAIAWQASKRANLKEDISDDDKGEYKMTLEERKQFDLRWRLVFFPVQQTEYIYKAKDMYDGYSNK